jgi:hypothetical protein
MHCNGEISRRKEVKYLQRGSFTASSFHVVHLTILSASQTVQPQTVERLTSGTDADEYGCGVNHVLEYLPTATKESHEKHWGSQCIGRDSDPAFAEYKSGIFRCTTVLVMIMITSHGTGPRNDMLRSRSSRCLCTRISRLLDEYGL